MKPLDSKKLNSASIRLARVIHILDQAGKDLIAARHAVPDHYHQKQLHNLMIDLRELTIPIAGIVASLERGGRQ